MLVPRWVEERLADLDPQGRQAFRGYPISGSGNVQRNQENWRVLL